MAFGGGRELTLLCRLYSGCARPRLWRRAPLAATLALALGSGGCSLSYTLDSYLGGAKSDLTKPETTGSIGPPPSGKDVGKAANLPPESDLAYARAAASEVLRRGEKDASLPWENPHSGARGTVTPIASAYQQDGQTCRDFLASYVAGDAQAWLQGEACREKDGWQVRAFKPWRKS
ncbi:MAG TPA: RT0821/Lpp0805 family surface protein [Pseudolabrys sp.]|nr:RT0821/Lpp0805 family surface protein [Pseudolabrys sp.]